MNLLHKSLLIYILQILLKNCQNVDKYNINPSIIDSLKPILASEDYEDSKLANALKAAHGLYK
jgi:hypothetical protein